MPRLGGLLRKGSITLAPNWELGPDLRRTHTYDQILRMLTAEQALTAKEIAVREAFDTGDYFDSIHGDLGTNRKGLVVGLVMADDFKANWIEHGYRTVGGAGTGGRGSRTRLRSFTGEVSIGRAPGKRILQRAARRSGLRLRPRRLR